MKLLTWRKWKWKCSKKQFYNYATKALYDIVRTPLNLFHNWPKGGEWAILNHISYGGASLFKNTSLPSNKKYWGGLCFTKVLLSRPIFINLMLQMEHANFVVEMKWLSMSSGYAYLPRLFGYGPKLFTIFSLSYFLGKALSSRTLGLLGTITKF